MSFFVKLLLKAGVTLGVMLFGYQYMLGNGMGGLQIPGLSDLTNKTSKSVSELGNAVVNKDITVYQWVDENGVTQYGGTPPTGQGQYSKKEIHTNTNIMSAYKAPKQEEKPIQRAQVASVGSLYSVGGMKDVMDDAKGTKEQMNERASQQESALNDLMKKINHTK